MKRSMQSRTLALFFAVAAFSCLGSAAWAEGSAVPGRAVGHVFLGMDRADVWKILQKPRYSDTVPHGMSLYSEDTWVNAKYELSVVSERDKVVQIEFNSPRLTTPDGLSTQSTLDQIRRRHPHITVRAYNLVYRPDPDDGYVNGADGFYLDDVHAGIAFTIETQDAVDAAFLRSSPSTIIVHKIGRRALPICGGHWSTPAAPEEDKDEMRVIRSWFTLRKDR